jgi:hypothetical protein
MDRSQIIPFVSAAPQNLTSPPWSCPITGEPVVDGLHAGGSRCWDPSGHPLQMMPAGEGWRAVYRDEDRVVTVPVVCWVLTEYCGGIRGIVGWVSHGTCFAPADDENIVGFDGYLEPGSPAPTIDTTQPSTQNNETRSSDEPVIAAQ